MKVFPSFVNMIQFQHASNITYCMWLKIVIPFFTFSITELQSSF